MQQELSHKEHAVHRGYVILPYAMSPYQIIRYLLYLILLNLFGHIEPEFAIFFVASCIIYVPLSQHFLSCYTPFHFMQRQCNVFFCYTINHSKYGSCLICVFVRCVTEQPSFSQQSSSVSLLSSLILSLSSLLI